jgi:hypothetical protein
MDFTSSVLVALIGICIGGAGLLAWLLYRSGEPIFPRQASSRARTHQETAPQRRRAPTSFSPPDTEAVELERRLLRMALGDHDVVVRLTEFERHRDPGASQATLLRRAIKRWQHDRR